MSNFSFHYHNFYRPQRSCGKVIEFSLNDFLWIQRIQWIMTKSKSSMVTRDILYLAIDIFLNTVVKSNFPLLSVGWYLFRVVTGNIYLPRHSNENTICITSTGNVSVARWVISLVTILFLDLVMIHWICWIQGEPFRENSIVLHLSVILSTGGCLPQCVLGYTIPGRHAPGQTPPGQTPPQQTATAVDGTHPTGMHSCSDCIVQIIRHRNLAFEVKMCPFHNMINPSFSVSHWGYGLY